MPICPKCKEDRPESNYKNKNGERIYSQCHQCRVENARKTMRKRRLHYYSDIRSYLLDDLDPKCRRCGYQEFTAMLDFYHPGLNKSLLPPLINRYTYSPTPTRWQAILAEVNSSTLLCKNCREALRLGLYKPGKLPTEKCSLPMPT